MKNRNYSGIWPVAPTPFKDNGEVDYPAMKRLLDCMIDQGVDGICILANFSEQFSLNDSERELLTKLSIEQINGRVPVIVTISHYATNIVLERARLAKSLSADIVMLMPPYHGALIRANEAQVYQQIATLNDIGIPIMLQDAPLSGIDLSVEFLVRLAQELEMVKLFKIETAGAANKIEQLISQGGDAIEGPFDGEEGINLLADLDAGARGAMTSALIPDLIKPVIAAYTGGNRETAKNLYADILPIINHENRQCGFRAAKTAFYAGGIIGSDYCRHPCSPMPELTKKLLLELLKAKQPLILEWGSNG